jgi:hypothetical protein
MEVKTRTGRLTDSHKEMKKSFETLDIRVGVAPSVKDAYDFLVAQGLDVGANLTSRPFRRTPNADIESLAGFSVGHRGTFFGLDVLRHRDHPYH